MYVSVFQIFGQMQYVGALHSPNQLQHSDQLNNPVIQGLREALSTAVHEIKSLMEENKALKELTGLLEKRQPPQKGHREKAGSNTSPCGDPGPAGSDGEGAQTEHTAVEEHMLSSGSEHQRRAASQRVLYVGGELEEDRAEDGEREGPALRHVAQKGGGMAEEGYSSSLRTTSIRYAASAQRLTC